MNTQVLGSPSWAQVLQETRTTRQQSLTSRKHRVPWWQAMMTSVLGLLRRKECILHRQRYSECCETRLKSTHKNLPEGNWDAKAACISPCLIPAKTQTSRWSWCKHSFLIQYLVHQHQHKRVKCFILPSPGVSEPSTSESLLGYFQRCSFPFPHFVVRHG